MFDYGFLLDRQKTFAVGVFPDVYDFIADTVGTKDIERNSFGR